MTLNTTVNMSDFERMVRMYTTRGAIVNIIMDLCLLHGFTKVNYDNLMVDWDINTDGHEVVFSANGPMLTPDNWIGGV